MSANDTPAKREEATDAERIDALEKCIRDGSYLSIFNDIINGVQVTSAIWPKGNALRLLIDMNLHLGEFAP